MACAPALR